jgi:putative ABC transport system substrate-binding protein
MDRRAFLGTLAGGLLAAPLVAEAQTPGKVYRIGLLSPASQGLGIEAFREGLRALGYVEGHNIVIEYRSAEGRFDRLPDLAAQLVLLKVDVIVAVVTQASLAAKNATSTIPIVMLAVGDPVGAGLVASLARPGRNITGTSALAVEIAGKSLEMLKHVVPKLRLVAVIWNPANAVFQAQMVKETEVAARALGIQLQMFAARDSEEIDRAFGAVTRERAAALTVIVDPVFIAHRARIAALAVKSRLPSVSAFKEYAEAGGLMAYAANFSEPGRRAASYVDKILKGAKPADLPVEEATKFELVINLKTAKALGLTVPPSLLQRADQVIE